MRNKFSRRLGPRIESYSVQFRVVIKIYFLLKTWMVKEGMSFKNFHFWIIIVFFEQ